MIMPGGGKGDGLDLALDRIQEVNRFSGEPKAFWSLYLEALLDLAAADAGLIAGTGGESAPTWKILASAAQANSKAHAPRNMQERLPELAAMAARDGHALLEDATATLFAIRLETGAESQDCIAAFHLPKAQVSQARERIALLGKVNDLASHYRGRKSLHEAVMQKEQFAGILDLMVLLNAQTRFLSAAMAFSNELAARQSCSRVSVGWHTRGYMRLKAMSHADTFDKKMDAVQKLELSMEEAFDQDMEILIPAPEGSRAISRDHLAYARSQDAAYLCSLPLRADERTFAVCTLERNSAPFSANEVRLLRLACDQAARRLLDLWSNDRWLGRLLLERIRSRVASWKGFEHTWAKVGAIGAALGLLILGVLPVTYRLESPAILRTDRMSYLTAPFDGHIERVNKRVGDEAELGEELIRLDRSDLLLQQAEREAERDRYAREAEKAEATNALADMLIAQALRDQAAARLEIILQRLRQADIQAPFAGVIVEGDLKERIGSPVKQGDMLMKIAELGGAYAELEVPESEVHHVKEGQAGEIALASRPQETFPIKLVRIEPSSVVKKDGNVFLARCAFSGETPAWWRPGMTGVTKLDAGRKTLLWVLTHRTMDFLRLKLWW